eukprot:s819_g18.t1
MDVSKLAADATQQAEAGHFRKAAQLFAKASQKDPNNAKHHEARAQCLMELDDFQEALRSAEAAVQLDSNWLPAKATQRPEGDATGLGRAQLNVGQFEDAVMSLEDALRLAEHDEEWRSDMQEELEQARNLLEIHYSEHHDVRLPSFKRGKPLQIRQALDCRYCRMEGELGPGGALWAAGASLATLISTEGPRMTSTDFCAPRPTVLELGSGTGAAGLAFAATGAKVLLTDRQSLLPLLRINVDLNKDLLSTVGGAADIGEFDWLSPPEEILRQQFDLVIGADLVYSFAAVEPFMAAVTALLQDTDGKRAAMHQALSSAGFDAQVRAMPKAAAVGNIPDEAMSRVQLLEIRPQETSIEIEPQVQ